MNKLPLLLLFLYVLAGCRDSTPHPSLLILQEFCGRDVNNGTENTWCMPIYRAKVPPNWIRHDPVPGESLLDTTKSICEFTIQEGEEQVRIALHNFPSEQIEERIPPGAQIARWKQQFTTLTPTDLSITPQAQGGFSGLAFVGTGMLNGKLRTVMGWSMQLAPEHYRILSLSSSTEQAQKQRQMRADYTIKVTGPKALVDAHKGSIAAFAKSFELIQAIPTRS